MAELTIRLYDLNNDEIVVNSIEFFELTRDVDAVCDGLRTWILSSKSLPEINRVRAYLNGEIVFNGYADTQRESVSENGYKCFIYARSTGCILLDNDAVPFTYNKPCIDTLFVENARQFGFKSLLPKLTSEAQYQVGRGVSCYGAMNDFVYGITGKNIVIDCDNNLSIATDVDTVNLNSFDVLTERRSINRGDVISRIDYKNDNVSDYIYHMKSRFFEEKGIQRAVKLNYSSYPGWQKELTILNRLRKTADDYYKYHFDVDGFHIFKLYDNVKYFSDYLGELEDCYISSCRITLDKNGERTSLTLNKKIDLKEISYVAK